MIRNVMAIHVDLSEPVYDIQTVWKIKCITSYFTKYPIHKSDSAMNFYKDYISYS